MKLGLTCEGGASRTLFSCGVLDLFLEENLMPDYFIGVSAGIAFGVSYLSKQKGRNWTLTEKYMSDGRYMGVRHLFNRKQKSFYNLEFVFEEIPYHLLPFDYEALEKFDGKIVAGVTNIRTGQAEYLEVPRGHDMRDYLIASCALPVLFQPVKIGKKYYLDGGVADSIPYRQAMKEGCDKNIVILTRSRDYVKNTERSIRVVKTIYRKFPNVVEAMETRAERYNACIKELRELEEQGKIFVIAPEDTFGIGRTESRPERLRQLYDEGYEIAKSVMPKLQDYLY